MAWETRERGGLYYTRSRKEGGRVIREYIGCGELAVLIAHSEATRRRVREERAAAMREEQERTRELEEPLEELCEVSDLMVRASLMASGYHQHKRGEWRMKREPKETRKQTG